ncbi:1-acyl-sn-glycerol-3-phosphate acyltransferase [Alicyclobacillus tolerans]|uniref:1-acyl-sn-glycerol-3-phosphate acyltransferase n=1 Tax=Alicyclobacillus tolerans TaxID=90970 RepID=UPI003B75F322
MIRNRLILTIVKAWIGRRVLAQTGPSLPKPPFIISANHTSYFDHFVLIRWMLLQGLPWPRFISKNELFETPVSRWFNRIGGGIPLEREGIDTEGFSTAFEVLQKGGILVVYPEGTRSRDGYMRAPRRGVASLAAKAQVPVVPVGLLGVNDVLPVGQKWPKHKRTIVLVNGEALEPPTPNRDGEREFVMKLSLEIARLSGQLPTFLRMITNDATVDWPNLEGKIAFAHENNERGFHFAPEEAVNHFYSSLRLLKGYKSPYALVERGRAHGQLAMRSNGIFQKLYHALCSRMALGRSVRLIPHYPLAWHAWAVLMGELPRFLGGSQQKALVGHRVSVALDPSWRRGILYLARSYYRSSQNALARNWVRRLLQTDARCEGDERRYYEAIELLGQINSIDEATMEEVALAQNGGDV